MSFLTLVVLEIFLLYIRNQPVIASLSLSTSPTSGDPSSTAEISSGDALWTGIIPFDQPQNESYSVSEVLKRLRLLAEDDDSLFDPAEKLDTAEARADVEILENAPRLREVVSHTKSQQVYEEQGYEDLAYDHGGYKKAAQKEEKKIIPILADSSAGVENVRDAKQAFDQSPNHARKMHRTRRQNSTNSFGPYSSHVNYRNHNDQDDSTMSSLYSASGRRFRRPYNRGTSSWNHGQASWDRNTTRYVSPSKSDDIRNSIFNSSTGRKRRPPFARPASGLSEKVAAADERKLANPSTTENYTAIFMDLKPTTYKPLVKFITPSKIKSTTSHPTSRPKTVKPKLTIVGKMAKVKPFQLPRQSEEGYFFVDPFRDANHFPSAVKHHRLGPVTSNPSISDITFTTPSDFASQFAQSMFTTPTPYFNHPMSLYQMDNDFLTYYGDLQNLQNMGRIGPTAKVNRHHHHHQHKNLPSYQLVAPPNENKKKSWRKTNPKNTQLKSVNFPYKMVTIPLLPTVQQSQQQQITRRKQKKQNLLDLPAPDFGEPDKSPWIPLTPKDVYQIHGIKSPPSPSNIQAQSSENEEQKVQPSVVIYQHPHVPVGANYSIIHPSPTGSQNTFQSTSKTNDNSSSLLGSPHYDIITAQSVDIRSKDSLKELRVNVNTAVPNSSTDSRKSTESLPNKLRYSTHQTTESATTSTPESPTTNGSAKGTDNQPQSQNEQSSLLYFRHPHLSKETSRFIKPTQMDNIAEDTVINRDIVVAPPVNGTISTTHLTRVAKRNDDYESKPTLVYPEDYTNSAKFVEGLTLAQYSSATSGRTSATTSSSPVVRLSPLPLNYKSRISDLAIHVTDRIKRQKRHTAEQFLSANNALLDFPIENSTVSPTKREPQPQHVTSNSTESIHRDTLLSPLNKTSILHNESNIKKPSEELANLKVNQNDTLLDDKNNQLKKTMENTEIFNLHQNKDKYSKPLTESNVYPNLFSFSQNKTSILHNESNIRKPSEELANPKVNQNDTFLADKNNQLNKTMESIQIFNLHLNQNKDKYSKQLNESNVYPNLFSFSQNKTSILDNKTNIRKSPEGMENESQLANLTVDSNDSFFDSKNNKFNKTMEHIEIPNLNRTKDKYSKPLNETNVYMKNQWYRRKRETHSGGDESQEENEKLVAISIGSSTTQIPVNVKKYPFYTIPSIGLAKFSVLRYISNPKDIPVKEDGKMSFYESRNKRVKCSELQPPENVVPERGDEGEWAHNPEPELPRVQLGDQIKCLKMKFFGEDPLDNPFFKEEGISYPEVFTGGEERGNSEITGEDKSNEQEEPAEETRLSMSIKSPPKLKVENGRKLNFNLENNFAIHESKDGENTLVGNGKTKRNKRDISSQLNKNSNINYDYMEQFFNPNEVDSVLTHSYEKDSDTTTTNEKTREYLSNSIPKLYNSNYIKSFVTSEELDSSPEHWDDKIDERISRFQRDISSQLKEPALANFMRKVDDLKNSKDATQSSRELKLSTRTKRDIDGYFEESHSNQHETGDEYNIKHDEDLDAINFNEIQDPESFELVKRFNDALTSMTEEPTIFNHYAESEEEEDSVEVSQAMKQVHLEVNRTKPIVRDNKTVKLFEESATSKSIQTSVKSETFDQMKNVKNDTLLNPSQTIPATNNTVSSSKEIQKSVDHVKERPNHSPVVNQEKTKRMMDDKISSLMKQVAPLRANQLDINNLMPVSNLSTDH